MSRCVSLNIPYPPSANRLWRAVNGRQIKSAHYRAWTLEAATVIRSQLPGRHTIDGPYHLMIKATRPDNRRRDLGNLEKPLSDALVTAGVIADDSNCQILHLFWADGTVKGGAVEVIVKEAA